MRLAGERIAARRNASASRVLVGVTGGGRSSSLIDSLLPIELARARRETELAFAQLEGGDQWYNDLTLLVLVGAGLKAVFRLLK
ncbi:MAG TPA: hypothetical protein VGF24_25345 [Vicinamibacterales bacterium]|jgi:hypothetical protein